jgi:hypothetical protein
MNPQRSRFPHWVVENWSRTGFVMAIVLLLIAPLIARFGNRVLLFVYLWLPFYMFHQYEEHGQGTFLEFYRRMMPRIAPMLTERKLLIVNLGIVWLLFLVSIYAATYGLFWLALYPVYLSLVNAFMHIGQWITWRSYNPGLWTALVIFIPGAVYTIRIIHAAGATPANNLTGFALGFLTHVFLFAVGRGWIASRL